MDTRERGVRDLPGSQVVEDGRIEKTSDGLRERPRGRARRRWRIGGPGAAPIERVENHVPLSHGGIESGVGRPEERHHGNTLRGRDVHGSRIPA